MISCLTAGDFPPTANHVFQTLFPPLTVCAEYGGNLVCTFRSTLCTHWAILTLWAMNIRIGHSVRLGVSKPRFFFPLQSSLLKCFVKRGYLQFSNFSTASYYKTRAVLQCFVLYSTDTNSTFQEMTWTARQTARCTQTGTSGSQSHAGSVFVTTGRSCAMKFSVTIWVTVRRCTSQMASAAPCVRLTHQAAVGRGVLVSLNLLSVFVELKKNVFLFNLVGRRHGDSKKGLLRSLSRFNTNLIPKRGQEIKQHRLNKPSLPCSSKLSEIKAITADCLGFLVLTGCQIIYWDDVWITAASSLLHISSLTLRMTDNRLIVLLVYFAFDWPACLSHND